MGEEPNHIFFRANMQKDWLEQSQHVVRQVQTMSICGKSKAGTELYSSKCSWNRVIKVRRKTIYGFCGVE